MQIDDDEVDASLSKNQTLPFEDAPLKEVATRLDVSPKTADNHVQNIYGKIGVTTSAAAALYAVEAGFLKAGEALNAHGSTRMRPKSPVQRRAAVRPSGGARP